jgi:hypothetical protein
MNIRIETPLAPGELVMVKTQVGEVLHTVNGNGQLVPLGVSLLADVPLRERAAIAAMQGIVTHYPLHECGVEKAAFWAVKCADALIAELRKEVQP